MALLSDYQSRYSMQIRVNLSNPQSSSATTVDSTRESLAATDAQADFEAVCGVTYSSSVTTHVTAAVPLVAAKLMVYTGQANDDYYTKALERCTEVYKLVLGRNRISPTTDSTLSPTTPEFAGKPFSDIANWKKLVGNSPSGTNITATSGDERPRID